MLNTPTECEGHKYSFIPADSKQVRAECWLDFLQSPLLGPAGRVRRGCGRGFQCSCPGPPAPVGLALLLRSTLECVTEAAEGWCAAWS